MSTDTRQMSTETVYTLPDAAQVSSLLGLLFDGLTAKVGPKFELSVAGSNFVGVYVNDAKIPVAACACDLAFAAGSGAALSMLPPKAAADAVKAKDLTPMMASNLHEILNVCTRLLLKDHTPHLKLQGVLKFTELSTDVRRLLIEAKQRVDFTIGLDKHAAGKLTVLTR